MQPPAELAADCVDPVDIPPGPVNAGPAERLWGEDRDALALCAARHKGLAAFYRDLLARLGGLQ